MLTASKDSDSLRLHFWLCIAFLFLTVLAFHGKTVPYNNEWIYLLRLDPSLLQHDWSFAQPANEHWLFNSVFGNLSSVFSIVTIGWIGRIAVWILCLIALVRLGKQWKISYLALTFSVGLWLAFEQAVVNREWIFGTFEAKTVAYACLLFALSGFSARRIVWPSMLLGLSFSFHPAVGLWAILGVGFALLIARTQLVELARFAGLTALFSLPGLLPLLSEQSIAGGSSYADWQFIVTNHMPFHFDPFDFPGIGMIVLAAMSIFNIAALWKDENFALRFLLKFQLVLGAFFMLGVALRLLEQFELLRFMPMRLFPIFTPIFFLFTAFHLISRVQSVKQKLAVYFIAIAIVASLNPIQMAIGQLRETKESWQAKPDDAEVASTWMSENTPSDAVIVASPNTRKLWHYSNRAQIVAYDYPRFERLTEWRNRMADLTGNADLNNREMARETLDTSFERLTEEQILSLKQKYAATHVLSRTLYSFPVIFETDSYKVYKLP